MSKFPLGLDAALRKRMEDRLEAVILPLIEDHLRPVHAMRATDLARLEALTQAHAALEARAQALGDRLNVLTARLGRSETTIDELQMDLADSRAAQVQLESRLDAVQVRSNLAEARANEAELARDQANAQLVDAQQRIVELEGRLQVAPEVPPVAARRRAKKVGSGGT
jgi:chromosome segregation ATPase